MTHIILEILIYKLYKFFWYFSEAIDIIALLDD